MTVVVIPSGEKGDRLAGSLDVKVPDGRDDRSDPHRGASNLAGRSRSEPVSPEILHLREADLQDEWESRAMRSPWRRPMSESNNWIRAIPDLPGDSEGGMPEKSSPRKPGTTRRLPRSEQTDTAMAAHITCQAGKVRRACEWGGWGR